MSDMNLRLGDAVLWTDGRLEGGCADQLLTRVSTDSRGELRGALFLALRGERFDGHDFVRQAQAQGAAAAVVERAVHDCALPQLVVPCAQEALGRLARQWRRRFAGKVAAVTGSAGKTTTRSMLATLMTQRLRTHQPERNFNNHVGVPLTILALRDEHEAAVLELGCSDFGEIRALTEIAEPDLGLVTNVGAAHLEKLGDLDGVARAKGELFAAMKPDGVCVVNIDDPRVAAMQATATRRLTYGTSQRADVRLVSRTASGGLQRLRLDLLGREIEAALQLGGRHNAFDALAAAAAATALGLQNHEIASGIEACRSTAGRMALCRSERGFTIIDDTYNANPSSMAASLEAAAELKGSGRLIAVLGDMLELGHAAQDAHIGLGRSAARTGADFLIVMGEHASEIREGALAEGLDAARCVLASSHEEAANQAVAQAADGDVVLVKGSRGMKMENVVRLIGVD